MKKEKKNNKFLVAVVALVLLAVGVGYAALTREFTLDGTAKIGSNSWKIEVPTTDPKPTCTGTNACTEPEVTEQDGKVKVAYTADLKKPGDTYTVTVPIKNNGKTAAKIDTIVGDQLATALKSGDTAANVAKYLTFTFGGDFHAASGEGAGAVEATTLAAGESKNVTITLKFKDAADLNADDLTSLAGDAGVTLKFETVLTFGQA